jgi:hypothetical protein
MKRMTPHSITGLERAKSRPYSALECHVHLEEECTLLSIAYKERNNLEERVLYK